MNVAIVTYVHPQNGLSLFVVPETPQERAVLQGLWKHGTLAKCNGVADGTGEGFAVHWEYVQS